MEGGDGRDLTMRKLLLAMIVIAGLAWAIAAFWGAGTTGGGLAEDSASSVQGDGGDSRVPTSTRGASAGTDATSRARSGGPESQPGEQAGKSQGQAGAERESVLTRVGALGGAIGRSAMNRLEANTYRVLHGREGYWRLGQTYDGVWWFVSPEGKQEWLNTVTTVQPFQLARDKAGVQFISRDYDGGITENGDMRKWAEKTLERVRAAGFKGLGGWCNPSFHELDVPMTRDLNLYKWVCGSTSVLLFSPQWESLVDNAAKQQVEKLRDNKNLVGYYIDNELEWGDGFVGPRLYFDKLPPTDPNRREVGKVIREIWPTVEKFNADWGTELKSWEEMDGWEVLPLTFPGADGPAKRGGNYSAYVRLLGVWMEHVAREYFRLTTTAIRKYDPNHLILGVRFKNWAPEEIVRASRGFTDAQSLNSYVGDARLDREMFEMIYRESGQPLIITEYSFHALDGRSGNRNTVGFAAQVLDQRARAEGYRQMTTRLARVPWVIGADWFQWADEPPSGRHFDGEDVNFGIVDIDDREYEHMVRAVRETAPKLNELHRQSSELSDPDRQGPGQTAGADIWRESYREKPLMRVPYLTSVPTLNGELSDWPNAARLVGVRHSKTLGLERSRVPLPNVFLGWREEGLYLAMEVFDDDIQGADPKGWWWTRDAAEWWIATRVPGAEQNYYDGFCHQFFFVPSEFPRDGLSGTVGRWHRPGDNMMDHLIPHPEIRQVARVLPGRYVVEMLIPASALSGWDPVREPRMSFNLHMRNWQHAIDYFWSAPKEMQTQLRPNTWGTLYLMPNPGGR